MSTFVCVSGAVPAASPPHRVTGIAAPAHRLMGIASPPHRVTGIASPPHRLMGIAAPPHRLTRTREQDMTDALERQIMRIPLGDKEAFKTVYESTRSAVFGFALSILRNRSDAEDVMHDTYLRVFRGAASYEPMGRPLTWILTIARNLAYNRIRDARNMDNIDDHMGIHSEHGMGRAETNLLLESALEALSEEECQIVILHAVTGWKHREIAEWMDMPLSTVLSKYRRALQKMREEIGGKEEAAND